VLQVIAELELRSLALKMMARLIGQLGHEFIDLGFIHSVEEVRRGRVVFIDSF
jgi:hypothetical protein